jgi:hypothetical protein
MKIHLIIIILEYNFGSVGIITLREISLILTIMGYGFMKVVDEISMKMVLVILHII